MREEQGRMEEERESMGEKQENTREEGRSVVKRYLLRLLLVLLFSLAGGGFTYVIMISQWPEESHLVRLESLRYIEEEESPESFENFGRGEELPDMASLQAQQELAPQGWEVDHLEVVLKVLSGRERGSLLSVVLEQLRDGTVPLQEGRAYVLLVDSFPDGEHQYYISDSFRAPWVVMFLFAALGGIMASAGMAGVRALLGLLLSLGVLLYWYVPLLRQGISPVPYALVVVFLISAFTVVLVVRRKRWWPVAFLGSAGGALAAFLLGWFLVWLWQLTGLAGEGGALLSSILPHISLRGILLASVIIGSIGAVLDVGISVTATMAELAAYDPGISPSRLWKSGIGAGREVLGSMINTLVLAYVGSALPFVLLVAESGISLMGFLNNPSIAEELVRSLAGTLGLLLTVPITAFLGMLWHGRNGEGTEGEQKDYQWGVPRYSVILGGSLRLYVPSAPEWSNRSLALLLRTVTPDAPSVARLGFAGTSCASTGSPRRKAALADHYGRCREHTSSGSWSSAETTI